MEGHAEPVRVRAAYVTDDDIKAMARDYKPVSSTTVRTVLGDDTEQTDQAEDAARHQGATR
jgi:S-DNA-T family DNA segregation ATPase FtsK/SpoIIIE